jgi:mono/diheme cytochrome c family protein
MARAFKLGQRPEVLQVKNALSYGKLFEASKNLDSNGDIGMSGLDKGASLWLARVLGVWLVLGMGIFAVGRVAADDAPKPWVAPADAKKVKNPVPATQETLAAAQMLFQDNCVLCHGEKGLGDGPGAKTLKVKPANFTDHKLMASETDGSLYWKMTTGRGPMPSWKEDLTDKDRWELVNYIRKLTKDAAKK